MLNINISILKYLHLELKWLDAGKNGFLNNIILWRTFKILMLYSSAEQYLFNNYK